MEICGYMYCGQDIKKLPLYYLIFLVSIAFARTVFISKGLCGMLQLVTAGFMNIALHLDAGLRPNKLWSTMNTCLEKHLTLM